MTRQIHCIVEETQDLDYLAVSFLADSEHDEMTPLTAVASDMQREKSWRNVVARADADDARAGSQRLQCAG